MAIQARTTSGVEVMLTGVENCGRPEVRVEFTHPKAGAIQFDSGVYGRVQGQDGIIGWVGRQRACVTVSRAAFDAAMAEARLPGEKRLADLRSGATPITPSWQDGEILSGYAVGGEEADLLEKIGLAKSISGWGRIVDRETIERLGESFTYAQAEALAREKAEAKKVARGVDFALEVAGRKFRAGTARGILADALTEASRDTEAALLRTAEDVHLVAGRVLTTAQAQAEAVHQGQRIELNRWSEPCDGSADECDLDLCTRYAQPDGSTRVERIHTH